jgi:TolB-like protein/class 3 adenylate cyclase
LQQERRRLAAILAADVAGYSGLMAADESGTLARLRQLRTEAIEPKIAEYHGRIVGSAGDSLLVEFASALSAVQCAVEAQAGIADRNADLPEDRKMAFRMGVNLGDVIPEGDTIYGDGVNIAARLEKVAKPGSVCIGRSVYDQVKGKLAYSYADLGEQRFKNIPEPVRAYCVTPARPAAESSPASSAEDALPLPDQPSIAVLPFQNMSGDPEQEYFADGMVEEITTALSRFRWLFVIARNSSFIYKGKAVEVKQVGRELGVRYVLEGSVRKAASRVRITGQLIDASTGAHLWADRFDGQLEDVFDLQDQVTSSVVGAIAPKLEQAEIERAKRKPTENLDAYDYFLRGMSAFHQFSKSSNEAAVALFARATEIDPGYAAAYGMAARCYLQRIGFAWVTDRQHEVAEAERLARLAADRGRDDAIALCTAGAALIVVVGDLEDGVALLGRSLALNPNLSWAWHFSAIGKAFLGEHDVAIEQATRAMRLSPQDPQMFGMQIAIAWAHFFAGRYDEALSWAEAAVRGQSNFFMGLCVAATSAGLAGRLDEARKALTRVLEMNPALRMSNLRYLLPFHRPQDFEQWAEGFRRAGLPP